MTLVFWQNIISPHQAPFLRVLAEIGHDVTVVATESMTADRLAMGWQAPDLGAAKVILGPEPDAVRDIVEHSSKESVHVMAGARWTPLGRQAMRCCLVVRRRMGVLTEAPDPRGVAGLGRYVKYTAERIGNGRHFDFILGMGEMGVRWFKRCGYPLVRIFPFAYVTEMPGEQPPNGEARCNFSYLYVGQLVPRKGLDLLLNAFAMSPIDGLRLQLVGDGPEEERLRLLADSLGIANQVEWLGGKNSTEVSELMTNADVVVLPSRHDGWGAVVNEALMTGTPVICSDACGAFELIRQPWLGTVYPTGNVEALAGALQKWAGNGCLCSEARHRIRTWSQCIEGRSVAQYFSSVISHTYNGSPRPCAPWRLQTTPDD